MHNEYYQKSMQVNILCHIIMEFLDVLPKTKDDICGCLVYEMCVRKCAHVCVCVQSNKLKAVENMAIMQH